MFSLGYSPPREAVYLSFWFFSVKERNTVQSYFKHSLTLEDLQFYILVGLYVTTCFEVVCDNIGHIIGSVPEVHFTLVHVLYGKSGI